VRYPFFHLKSDGIWSPLDEHGKPTAERFQARFAAMPSDLLRSQRTGSRDRARGILIAKYFQPDERLNLYALVGMPVPAEDEIARDANYKEPSEAQKQGREARFRLSIIPAYNYTLRADSIPSHHHYGPAALSMLRTFTSLPIRANNDPRNGLALSKNATGCSITVCGLSTTIIE